ncbi:MAG: T9SS type A sorting domain-containing protein [Bacteroidota bacterium]
MNKILLLFCSFVVFSHTAFAQITFPETFITDRIGRSINETIYALEVTAAMDAVVNATGANQTWDFNGAVATDSFSVTATYVALPADLPGSDNPAFENANIAITGEDEGVETALYYQLENGNYWHLGSTSLVDTDGDGIAEEVTGVYSPPSLDIVFPGAFENTWMDSTSVMIAGVPFATDIETSVSVVDGWGTLITPDGNSVQALRVREEFRTYDPVTMQLTEMYVDIDIVSLDGYSVGLLLDASGAIEEVDYFVDMEVQSTPIESFGQDLPESFTLSQNYPNPFNPSTRISYDLQTSSDVNLSVYSIEGKLVATLVSGTQPAGSYEVAFDASGLASGLYLYRLETSHFTQTRMMSLIK